MKSDLPEITLLVVNKNKQCNHSQHYLFQITTLLVSDHNITCFQVNLSSFRFQFSPNALFIGIPAERYLKQS